MRTVYQKLFLFFLLRMFVNIFENFMLQLNLWSHSIQLFRSPAPTQSTFHFSRSSSRPPAHSLGGGRQFCFAAGRRRAAPTRRQPTTKRHPGDKSQKPGERSSLPLRQLSAAFCFAPPHLMRKALKRIGVGAGGAAGAGAGRLTETKQQQGGSGEGRADS